MAWEELEGQQIQKGQSNQAGEGRTVPGGGLGLEGYGFERWMLSSGLRVTLGGRAL